eukprot:COSAG06_NODE_1032_length_11010_cov_13.156448_5_plen_37_part_00
MGASAGEEESLRTCDCHTRSHKNNQATSYDAFVVNR